jgi:hypothetical protein
MKNSPDKIERMKEVLAQSCPKASGDQRRSLPAAARQLLEENSADSSTPASLSWWERLQGLLRGPQLIAAGAVALLVIMVSLHFSNQTPVEIDKPKGQTMRSGSDEALPPLLVVLKNLDEQQSDAIRNSGYFQEEQIVTLEVDGDIQRYRDHQIVLVDGDRGEITTPFAPTGFSQAMASDPDEFVSQVLDALSNLPAIEE